jgi:hypothetical protein
VIFMKRQAAVPTEHTPAAPSERSAIDKPERTMTAVERGPEMSTAETVATETGALGTMSLIPPYDAGVPFIWNSYAAPFISVARIGPQSRARANSSQFGAVMKDESQKNNGNPYSPLMCILLLLATGVAVKSGAVTQLGQLAQNSYRLALNW